MKQPIIETERLILRPFCKTDSKDVQELAGKREISDTTLTIPHPYNDGMAEKWISEHPVNWTNRTAVTYAITDKVSKKLIGTVSLSKMNGGEAELGYWVGVPFWGLGYCTEAASTLIEFSFTKLGITKVRAEHLISNPASGQVMRKMGMRHIGRRTKADRNNQMAQLEVYEATNNTNT